MRSCGSAPRNFRTQSYVDTAVHEKLHSARVRQRQRALDQIKQIPRRKILLANLNPIWSGVWAGLEMARDRLQKRFTLGNSLPIRKRFPVGDVEPDQGVTLVARPSVSPRSQINSGAFGVGEGHGISMRKVCFEPSPADGLGNSAAARPE